MIYEAIIIWANGVDESIAHCEDEEMLAFFCRCLLERLYGWCDELIIDDGTVFKHPRSPHINTPEADIIIRPAI